jgi:hypothetical protein
MKEDDGRVGGDLTSALTAAFIPGLSPPLVRMAMFMGPCEN